MRSSDTPEGTEARARTEAIHIGSRRELFVDNFLVEKTDGVEFRLQTPQRQPRPKSPLVGGYATVIKEATLYRGYYRDEAPGYAGERGDGHPGEITCYAESRDGHEWTFPKLDCSDVAGPHGRNVILAGQAPFSHNFSPFFDKRPGVVASERFKALAGKRPAGLFGFASSDGIHWRKMGDTPAIPYKEEWLHAFDSQNVVFWSEPEGCYVCYLRTWATPHGRLRSVSRSVSEDFRTWSEPVCMAPNRPGEELYTTQTHPYFRAPHIYVATPTRFTHGLIAGKPALNEEGKRLNIGSTDILFMSSRAGSATYDRLFPEAFIRPGLDPERWENRANYMALNVVPTSRTEMSLYNARSGDRYTLRADGFVSVHAGATEGELRTRPILFEGDELRLNCSTSVAGSVRVEIQSADGAALPGFGLDDSEPLVGDTIDGAAAWKDNPNLAALAGKPVRLRFAMKECDLYSFIFQGTAQLP